MAEKNIKEKVESAKDGLPSNEDVIESLVKGVEDVCVEVDDKNENVKERKEINQSPSTSELKNDKIKNKETDCFNLKSKVFEQDEPEEINNVDNEDDDFIDEEHLKDLEFDYSEEDKETYKNEAEDLKNVGNNHFKTGEFKEAALNYTKALRICPFAFSKNRAVLYANRGAAKVKLGLNESAIEDCTKAVELDPQYLKAYLRRAQLYEQTDKLDEALADYNKILEIDPLHRDALFASKRLPEQINERNERLKSEMFGKLKDLGNMFLKPFGLSTNNFQMVQDPNTGGYSINFTQNPNQS
ncbi:tetratricopeptide repeat protein 1-like [Lycorma delicatula]|uniref:tetratricopeptide repeat protein 1-like n=1 Tax=Lycorma delicatula TaxID=130591 RepID=UPI003F511758